MCRQWCQVTLLLLVHTCVQKICTDTAKNQNIGITHSSLIYTSLVKGGISTITTNCSKLVIVKENIGVQRNVLYYYSSIRKLMFPVQFQRNSPVRRADTPPTA